MVPTDMDKNVVTSLISPGHELFEAEAEYSDMDDNEEDYQYSDVNH